jgi:hypothetical protein
MRPGSVGPKRRWFLLLAGEHRVGRSSANTNSVIGPFWSLDKPLVDMQTSENKQDRAPQLR